MIPTCFANCANNGNRSDIILAHPELANLLADFYVDDTEGKYKVHRPFNLLVKATNVEYMKATARRIGNIRALASQDMADADWHDEVDQAVFQTMRTARDMFDDAKRDCNIHRMFKTRAKAIYDGFILAAKIQASCANKFKDRGKATFNTKPSNVFAATPGAKHLTGPWNDKPLLAVNAAKQRNRLRWQIGYLQRRTASTYAQWHNGAKGTLAAMRRYKDQTLNCLTDEQYDMITGDNVSHSEVIAMLKDAQRKAQYHVQTIVKTEERKAQASHRGKFMSTDADQYVVAALNWPLAVSLQFDKLPDGSYIADPTQVDKQLRDVWRLCLLQPSARRPRGCQLLFPHCSRHTPTIRAPATRSHGRNAARRCRTR